MTQQPSLRLLCTRGILLLLRAEPGLKWRIWRLAGHKGEGTLVNPVHGVECSNDLLTLLIANAIIGIVQEICQSSDEVADVVDAWNPILISEDLQSKCIYRL